MYDWFDIRHLHVADIVGRWGDTSAVPALRNALERVWLLEQQSLGENEQIWWDYQVSLAYALGRLEAFDALEGMKLPAYRCRYWTIFIAMSYINANALGWNRVVDFLSESVNSQEHQDLYILLLQTLQQKGGLSLQEAEFYILSYNDDHAHIRYDTPEERRRNDSLA